jgi:hypothetical protein
MGTGEGDRTWRVVDDDLHEVLAQGSDRPPWGGRRILLAAAAVVAVAGGWFLATHEEKAAVPAAVDLPLPDETAPVAPTVPQLAGVWLVDKGPESFRPGEMWMAFHTDGSFVLDADGALLSDEPWVRGHYWLEGSALTLVVEDGSGCTSGDRFRWSVAMLPSGRLETRHESDNAGSCRVDPGVWRARPLKDTDMWRVSWRP